MRNYWPNQGAEDTTRVQWLGNSSFGTTVHGDSEFSTDMARSGNRSVKAIWPEPDGSGLPACLMEFLWHEGIAGNWRIGCWVYVPSGSPDIAFGDAFGPKQTMSTKDQWVNVEIPVSIDADHTGAKAISLVTDGESFAGVAYMDDIYAYPGLTGADPNEPEVKVEISWTGLPFDYTPEWDDITEYVQGFNPAYGRDSEIGSFEAGTCPLILDNPDGRFTPRRADSPYFPNVKPRRPVRITAAWDGAQWPIFRGHVDRWPVETAAGATTVEVGLVDAFGVLSKKSFENLYLNFMKDQELREIYPLNDGPESFAGLLNPNNRAKVTTPSGSIEAETLTGSSPSVQGGASDIFPNEAGLGSVAVTGVAWANTGEDATEMTGRLIEFPYTEFDMSSTSPGWSVSFWHAFDGSPAQGETIAEDYCDAQALRIEDPVGRCVASIIFNANPFFKGYTLYWWDEVYADPGSNWASHSDETADGFTHYKGKGNHVLLTFSNDCRGDGSNIPGFGLFVNGWGSYREIPGSAALFGQTYLARPFVGSQMNAKAWEGIGTGNLMSHDFRAAMFSIHDRPIDDVLGFATTRAQGNPAQAVNDRLHYLLDQVGWSDQLRHIDNGTDDSLIRFVSWDSDPNALDELRSPALDTNGLLFVSPGGYLTFHSRRWRQNPEPHFIFDHDAGTGIESPMSFDMSEQDIVNVANVDNAYGVKAQVRNESSVGEYDEVVKNIGVRLERDAEAIQFGHWQVNRFGEAQLRIDGVRINPAAHATGALWGHVLGMAPSVVVGLRNLPESAPDADADYFVEAVAHEVERSGDRLYWTTTLQVSPAANSGAWLLGDNTYGVLGETTRLHY